jgi:hypothetical protein
MPEHIVDFMGRVHFTLIVVAFLLFSSLVAFADDLAPDPSADAASGLSLTAGRDIMLLPGEHVPLVIFDSKANKPIQVAKINWTIDGQSLDQASATSGALSVPDDNPFSTCTIYTAPAQPTTKPTELKASVGDNAPVVLTTKVTIVDEPNCFTVDGDTGFGKRTVFIQLGDRVIPSVAGVYNGPFKLLADQYFVRAFGVDKADANSHVTIELELGTGIRQPGTYAWQGGDNPRDVMISFLKKGFNSRNADNAGNLGTLGGSSTLLEPDPADKSGLVKGFFCGNMMWAEFGRPQLVQGHYRLDIKKHFVTVSGHFAVPKGNP